ncbi:HNH endonuclease signature motif containing protein [Roseomonas chloroacetimidivorans]|uniref:HNH endonuclease signature motif containing protein n=1 Tax=Roseomonas chloroacetimidivorans TaxID=1766656 RepID=UPI003C719D3B
MSALPHPAARVIPSMKLVPDGERLWRPMECSASHEVSNDGLVRRVTAAPGVRAGSLVQPFMCRGYFRYQLRHQGKKVAPYAHHAVASAFLGARPLGAEVAHDNGDALDNRVANLRYATPSENSFDKVLHARVRAGQVSFDHIWRQIGVIEDLDAAQLLRLGRQIDAVAGSLEEAAALVRQRLGSGEVK